MGNKKSSLAHTFLGPAADFANKDGNGVLVVLKKNATFQQFWLILIHRRSHLIMQQYHTICYINSGTRWYGNTKHKPLANEENDMDLFQNMLTAL
jgi:hypothetical protein